MLDSSPLSSSPNSTLVDRERFLAEDADALLYGTDQTQRVVGVEPSGAQHVRLYLRNEDGTTSSEQRPLRPWIVSTTSEPWSRRSPRPDIERLRGDLPLSYRIWFTSWNDYRAAQPPEESRDRGLLSIPAVASQYLISTGTTLFKGMAYEDVRRLQLDIETLGLDPAVPNASVIMVALKQGDTEELLLLEDSEANLLNELSNAMQRLDPDVIEGHNIFNFDLPYLVERARRAGVPLRFGRDGSAPTISSNTQRFKAGAASMPYTPVHVHGRHIVDTYQQLQRFDVQGRLSSYGLKNAIQALGLVRTDREFVSGEEIGKLWRSGERSRERLAHYALDDVRDVDTLSRVTVPTEFYQTQILPMTFQRATTIGTGRKIDDLMLRVYLSAGHSLAIAERGRPYPGGHVELLKTGIFGPVVKCDVESLYPSIMLTRDIAARTDVLKAYPLLLDDLTRRRIDAKRRAQESTGEEHALWDGLQGSFKVLINSFYGYLGFSGGRFNDYDAAEQVTLEGQRLIQGVVSELQAKGADPIEVDTDGVFFAPPERVQQRSDELAFIADIARTLPAGINLAHDGSYEKMLSLKLKTYALLDANGKVTLRGSALRNRKTERCFQQFIYDAAVGFLHDKRDSVRERYFELAKQIQQRTLSNELISQWTMINRNTIDKQPRLKRLLDTTRGQWRFGERIEVYERRDGTLGLIEDYQDDENVPLLLRRLRDSASRFEGIFGSYAEFDAFFPQIQEKTNLDMAREQEATEQLSLF